MRDPSKSGADVREFEEHK